MNTTFLIVDVILIAIKFVERSRKFQFHNMMQFRNAPLSGVLAGPARQDLRHLSPPHTPQGAAGLPGGAELARPVLLLQVLCVCQQSDGRQDVPQTGQAALQL